MVFLNFTALPGIAAVFGWELPRTNVVINEEEQHSTNTIVIYEKTIPKTLNIHDFIKFFESDPNKKRISAGRQNYTFHLFSVLFPLHRKIYK